MIKGVLWKTFLIGKSRRCVLFLSQRGLSIGGNKQELVALAFAANTLNMPIIPTAVEIEKSKLECYKNLLKVGDVILPDPFLIFDKWEDETQGMSHWPPVFITDVRPLF